MKDFKAGARIYNLFPRLVGGMEGWINHLDRIKTMDFEWIYINPFHYPGFSGSLYAVKDYYAFHPMFVNDCREISHLEQLKEFVGEAKRRGLKLMMDLVINHTAVDSVLVEQHPEWYKHNEDGSIKNPGCKDGDAWIVWGDLAQIDNLHSPDRENLWNYWLDMMKFYLKIGFDGFRCDAAYHVPSELWEFLIPNVKKEFPDALFFGETLGCTIEETVSVARAGFDYVFNSFKWWDLEENWFLEEYRQSVGCAPSVTFPETHDTKRYAADVDGNINLVKMRYAVSALFCAGVMMPLGYEYGFTKQVNVVESTPADWEETKFDISPFVKRVNEVKAAYKVFNEDNDIDLVDVGNGNIFAFKKVSTDGTEKALVLVNKNGYNEEFCSYHNLPYLLGKESFELISFEDEGTKEIGRELSLVLKPGEVKVVYAK